MTALQTALANLEKMYEGKHFDAQMEECIDVVRRQLEKERVQLWNVYFKDNKYVLPEEKIRFDIYYNNLQINDNDF